MKLKREIIETSDGSLTLFIPEMEEQYHSVNGAITESDYVFIKKGFKHHRSPTPKIFEVGFGTGLNALLTALEAQKLQKDVYYVSIEKYPLDKNEITKLDYGKIISTEAQDIYESLHNAEWNCDVKITKNFVIHKITGDLKTFIFPTNSDFDIIYFDAFGPDKQPNMWQPYVFKKIFYACNNNATFVTYSAKGEIRRQLKACGFNMERLPGPPGKRQMLRGTK